MISLAVVPGDRVTIDLLQQVGRRDQRPMELDRFIGYLQLPLVFAMVRVWHGAHGDPGGRTSGGRQQEGALP